MEREEIAARLAGLSPAKRALLERRRRGESPVARAAAAPAIGRRGEPGPAPLSFSQQRLWFLDQLEPGAPTYNLRVLLRLAGRLDRPALTRSFEEVVRRHEVLRTAFRVEAGVPRQIVLPHLALTLPWIDLTGLPASRRDEESLRQARRLAETSFDLARPPLLRVGLFALGAAEQHLLVVFHHIVSDGWSTGVLVREVGALYAAFQEGRSSPLPELPIQYVDFAVWQRGWLTGEVLEGHLGYWRERLAGIPAGLDLPTDRPRPAVQSFRGDSCRLDFGAGRTGAVTALARREGSTPFMVLAAGLLALLSRLSEQLDLAIGAPIANRTQRETEGLIGFFVNTLVLRADLGKPRKGNGGGDFRALLGQVREITLGAYAHQDLPFEELVAAIQPDRDLSRTPLFQVALALHNAPPLDALAAGLAIHPVELPVNSAKFDLAFILGEESGSLAGTLEYATDLYDRPTSERLCGQWLRLLTAAVEEPEADLASLDLLSAAERHQLLAEWNDTGAAPAADAGTVLLHQLFEARADLHPEAPAALWEAESLTYGELEARANRLANLLASLGAGPDLPVAIWMERSLDMLVALLGAAKAGATYLPIDAGWPADRAEAVLAATAAGVVLTRRAHLPAVEGLQWRLPRLGDAVCLDVETPEPPPEPLDMAATRELFDVVSERAVDWVTAAGFVSIYTGEPFAAAEVIEYRDRVAGLAAPWLGPESRVLEIGCGSGLILWELAPRVGRYVGLDPSARTQERNRERALREGYGNVEFPVGFAHEIETLAPAGAFDLVILASTVQFFPGLHYLERVLELALSRLAPGGAVLVADVMDPRRRDDFRRSLAEHAAAHPGSAAARAGSRPGEGRELYVDAGLFADLPAVLPDLATVRVRNREEGFANELRFRYDVILEKAVQGAAVPGPAARRRKRVWTEWHVAGASAGRPRPVSTPIDIAYVIHTSGSTGEPKGIVVQHRPAVELVRWINSSFAVGPGDRLLFVTSPAFDLSVYDVFGVLGAGGTVRVAEEATLRDPERLARLLREEPVTIWDSAPAALQQLAPLFAGPGRTDPRLRLVLLSGDWIPVPLPDLVRAAFPAARVVSLGGATEATVWSNFFPVTEVDPRWPSIPYGRPIENAAYHVLDRTLQPCPIGVPGDLHIGGACLCVGYARLPSLTAERFIPDPFASRPGARLYVTGDRARYGRDGNLEFLGRVDQQVKVRGYRIELEEIEAVLARHPGVRDAAVLAREDIPGDKRLVGYVVPAGEPAPSPAELRSALQQVMPDYMVPWTFVVLPQMPVSANGKLDRKALPAPRERAEAGADFMAPGNGVERALAAAWQEVLRLPRVGLADNFFELGGSSLLATQVISRVRQQFAVELSLRALFETRTLSALAERVATLRAEAADPAALVAVPHDGMLGALPLSFAQQRLWILDQLEPESPLYNIPGAVRLTGTLDPARLRRVLGEVVRRHEVLRTTFPAVDGQPTQEIGSAFSPPLPEVDLAGLPGFQREEETARRIAAEACLPFDLACGPLLRSTLLRLGETEHVVLLTFHHIVSDAWSVGIFLREIAALFADRLLPELPVQYADFAVWQRQWLTGERVEAELAYWRQQLAALPRILELPTDRPRPAEQSFRGRSRPVSFPAAFVAPLAKLGKEHGATLFMTVLAALATLLGRYAGQEDVVLGSPIAGRDRRETEGLIGFFINTLVLRVDLREAPGFDRLLARVRDMALGAYTHQNLPFERLVDELAPVRDPSHSPLFQAMLALQNIPAEPLRLPGLTLTPLPVESSTAKVDLLLSLNEVDGALAGFWEWSTDLFDRVTIDRLSEQLGTLLAGVAADPGRRLSELPLLSPAERHHLLEEWNDTAPLLPPTLQDACLHELFAAVARRTPEALAVMEGGANGRRLTYAELDHQADELAHRLIARGVGPEIAVGIAIDRSLPLLVAILGIWKAGGAYLPLDPDLPRERLTRLAGSVALILTLSRWRDRLPAGAAPIVALDALDAPKELATLSVQGSGRRATAQNLAYVLYTSGSTGVPKGIMISHRGLVHYLRWAVDFYAVERGASAAVSSPLNFDLTVTSLFAPLLAGRTVELRTEDDGVEALRAALASDADYSLVKLTPAHLELLRQDPAGWEQKARVRVLIVGGEALHGESLDLFRERNPETRVINEYGPTETVVGCAVYELPTGPPPSGPVSIGRPITGMRAHVLAADIASGIQPIGVPGELHLAGNGLARGYWELPGLTAEKFVPDPFAGACGERLYRTGDLVRRRPDGRLEFLGRIDHQVKVRGFRVELGEIEVALASHPAVRTAAVIAASGQRRLVAFWVATAELPEATETTSAALRAALRDRLPEYMVPAHFVRLESLPQTPNGKVDRRALLARAEEPETDRSAESLILPRTPAEERLAEIWFGVLRRPDIGVHDNFFELGGDSILAIQVISRAQQAGLALTSRDLFRHQTVAELALAAGAATISTPGDVAADDETDGEIPLTPIQRWFRELDLADPHHFNQALLLDLREPLNPGLLAGALQRVIDHHAALRFRFPRGEQGEWRQIASPPASPMAILAGIDLSALPEARRRTSLEAAAADLQGSLDLARGPLLRVALFDLGAGRQRLFLVLHHLIVDGVSWRILLDDLAAACRAFENGGEAVLPPVPESFRRWSRRLAEEARSAATAAELDYWLDASRTLARPLPLDRPEGANTVASARTLAAELDPEETRFLLEEVPPVYHSRINDALLTALVQAFAGWRGVSRLLVDLEGHGREELGDGIDLSRTVGWLTSLSPVFLELDRRSQDPGEHLKAIKEQLRAVPRGGIGYGLLRYLGEESQAARLRAMPAAEVVFNYLGQLDRGLPASSRFAAAPESGGEARSPRQKRGHLLEINGGVASGRLRFTWTYSENLHDRATVEALADRFLASLRSLIEHCRSGAAGGFTPSDFPEADFDQKDFDKLMARIDKRRPRAGMGPAKTR